MKLALKLLLWGAALALHAAHAASAANAAEVAKGAKGAGTVVAAALPSDSVYHLQAELVDQTGRPFTLDSHRGQPMLVSMFYTSCQFVCPMLVETIRHTQAQLPAAQRERLSVLLVSIDPEHDSVAVLKQTADQRQLDPKEWQLARTDSASVRKIAAVLGVQYRALGNGEFNHTTAVLLLDSEGRIVGRTSQLGRADPAFVKLVKESLQAAGR